MCLSTTLRMFLCQEDMETAKYVWRLCVARHRFYRLNQCDLWVSPALGIVGNHLEMAFIYLFCMCVRGPRVEVSGQLGESVFTMWVLGIELSSLSLAASAFHLLSHFVGPDFQVLISNFFALSRMANFIKWYLFLILQSFCFYEITFHFSIGTSSYSYKMPLRFFPTSFFFFWQGFAM